MEDEFWPKPLAGDDGALGLAPAFPAPVPGGMFFDMFDGVTGRPAASVPGGGVDGEAGLGRERVPVSAAIPDSGHPITRRMRSTSVSSADFGLELTAAAATVPTHKLGDDLGLRDSLVGAVAPGAGSGGGGGGVPDMLALFPSPTSAARLLAGGPLTTPEGSPIGSPDDTIRYRASRQGRSLLMASVGPDAFDDAGLAAPLPAAAAAAAAVAAAGPAAASGRRPSTRTRRAAAGVASYLQATGDDYGDDYDHDDDADMLPHTKRAKVAGARGGGGGGGTRKKPPLRPRTNTRPQRRVSTRTKSRPARARAMDDEDDDEKPRVGVYSPEERRRRIQRYLDKRKRRVWKKKINYRCRQKLADGRLRVKGRFVSRAALNRMIEEEKAQLGSDVVGPAAAAAAAADAAAAAAANGTEPDTDLDPASGPAMSHDTAGSPVPSPGTGSSGSGGGGAAAAAAAVAPASRPDLPPTASPVAVPAVPSPSSGARSLPNDHGRVVGAVPPVSPVGSLPTQKDTTKHLTVLTTTPQAGSDGSPSGAAGSGGGASGGVAEGQAFHSPIHVPSSAGLPPNSEFDLQFLPTPQSLVGPTSRTDFAELDAKLRSTQPRPLPFDDLFP